MSLTDASALPIGVIAADYLRKFTARRHATRRGSFHRTGAPVRRDSLEEGTFEDCFFVVPAAGETDRMVRVARAAMAEARHLKRKRRRGEHLTRRERSIVDLTPAAVAVYEKLCDLMRTCAGKVYPSYDYLEGAIAVGRRSVARVLPLLVGAGLLIVQRRFRRVEGDGPGPRYEQTSNAYRPMLAEKLLSLLPRWARPAPTPPDAIQREADRQQAQIAMLDRLNCHELAKVSLSGPLADVMAQLGRSIDAREREC